MLKKSIGEAIQKVNANFSKSIIITLMYIVLDVIVLAIADYMNLQLISTIFTIAITLGVKYFFVKIYNNETGKISDIFKLFTGNKNVVRAFWMELYIMFKVFCAALIPVLVTGIVYAITISGSMERRLGSILQPLCAIILVIVPAIIGAFIVFNAMFCIYIAFCKPELSGKEIYKTSKLYVKKKGWGIIGTILCIYILPITIYIILNVKAISMLTLSQFMIGNDIVSISLLCLSTLALIFLAPYVEETFIAYFFNISAYIDGEGGMMPISNQYQQNIDEFSNNPVMPASFNQVPTNDYYPNNVNYTQDPMIYDPNNMNYTQDPLTYDPNSMNYTQDPLTYDPNNIK